MAKVEKLSIKSLIKYSGYNQTQLEKRIGVGHSTFHKIIHLEGKYTGIKTMKKISDYFGVKITDIQEFDIPYANYIEGEKRRKLKQKNKKAYKEYLKDHNSRKEKIKEKTYPKKQCLNQKCPLNENKFCGSPIVLAGIAGCASENLITEPIEEKTSKEKKQIKIIKYNREAKNYEKCI